MFNLTKIQLTAEATRRAIEEGKEVVICAAVKAQDGLIVRCNRHAHGIFKPFGMQGIPGYENERCKENDQQGFITSRNRYVNREDGYRLQIEAGIPSADDYRGDELYSEDLY